MRERDKEVTDREEVGGRRERYHDRQAGKCRWRNSCRERDDRERGWQAGRSGRE